MQQEAPGAAGAGLRGGDPEARSRCKTISMITFMHFIKHIIIISSSSSIIIISVNT